MPKRGAGAAVGSQTGVTRASPRSLRLSRSCANLCGRICFPQSWRLRIEMPIHAEQRRRLLTLGIWKEIHVLIRVAQADPSWQVDLRKRNAILWVGPNLNIDRQSDTYRKLLRCITTNAWSAVYIDSVDILPADISTTCIEGGEVEVRLFVTDAGAERLPPNRLPVYFLRGPRGAVVPNSNADPAGLFLKYTMLQRAGACSDVFVIGASKPLDLAGVVEAARLSPSFRRLTVIGPA